jgi:hemerythrin-like domain-containing protein
MQHPASYRDRLISIIYTTMNDPIKMIKDDHKKVKTLFGKYEELGDEAFKNKQSLALEIAAALTLHAEMEETLFYPKLKEMFTKEDGSLVEEAYAEHTVAKELIAEIESMDATDEQFDAKVKVLRENIEHHVKEEEDELLPKAEKELPEEELEAIGSEMESFKQSHS